MHYDPDTPPPPEEWLAHDEQERIHYVEEYHRHHRIRLPNRRLHATFHVIVENQVAEAEPIVVRVLERLQDEGLDRHEAIHAIGSVLSAQMYEALQGHASDVATGYLEALEKLTAEKWLAG